MEWLMTCAGYLGHPFTELDVLRFIERAFLSKHTLGTYNHSGSESSAVLSSCLHRRRRGSVGVPTGHHHQTTSLLQLPQAPTTFSVLGQTTDDLPCARHTHRSSQGEIGPDRGKRVIATATFHPPSADQATRVQKDGPTSPGVTGQHGSYLETSALPCAAR